MTSTASLADTVSSPVPVAVAAVAANSKNKPNNNNNHEDHDGGDGGDDDKVKVHFVAVGGAPLMKRTKFQIRANQRFATVTAFLQKMLQLPAGSGSSSSSLFLYCQAAFVPSPDQLVGDLRDCFRVRDELVIHYSIQEAWG